MHFCQIMVVSLPYTGNKILSLLVLVYFTRNSIGHLTTARKENVEPSIPSRVSPFRFQKFFAYKRKEAKLDPFRKCFACSLQKFRSIFSLLFAFFRFKFFASLQLSYFRFEAKWTENLFSRRIFYFASKNTFFALFCFSMFVSNKIFADYRRTDSYTLHCNPAKGNFETLNWQIAGHV
jgi:hypothetical protein